MNDEKQNQVYENADRRCECWECELRDECVYRDRAQRIPRDQGGLGKCAKLKENKGKLQF